MRKQIAAANWKMNLTLSQAQDLMTALLQKTYHFTEFQEVIIAVPFPYLMMAVEKVKGYSRFQIAAQDCSNKKSGAFTGDVSTEMLVSVGVYHAIVGHSERREYHHETHGMLAEKVNICLETGVTPIFCCGEPLQVRDANTQNEYVSKQLSESLFHLRPEDIQKIVIAYEPVWAIGTGKTATTKQAQSMHAFIRSVVAEKYGEDVAGMIPILYGGSVKANNAKELFAQKDVDGGLVGGASLNAEEFSAIINSLK